MGTVSRDRWAQNVEVTGNADQIERVETAFDVNDPGKFELSREQHSPVHRRCS